MEAVPFNMGVSDVIMHLEGEPHRGGLLVERLTSA